MQMLLLETQETYQLFLNGDGTTCTFLAFGYLRDINCYGENAGKVHIKLFKKYRKLR